MTTPPPIPLAQQIELMERSVRLVTDERVAAGFSDVLASLKEIPELKAGKDVLIAALTKEIGAESVHVLLRNTRWMDELTAEAQRLGLYEEKEKK